jgi:hypothetical protein
MTARPDGGAGGGFTVLDGAAFVAGAAVASVQIRGALRGEPAGPGWVFLWGTFVWVALTATGPFLYLARGYARTSPGYPMVGDRLWAALGLPWLVSALLKTSAGGSGAVATVLGAGLGVASVVALVVVWTTWVVVTPERAASTFSPPWTNRVGLFLAVAWPVQCGAGMVVIG